MAIRKAADVPAESSSNLSGKGFKVYETSATVHPPLSYARRDYYKIVLASGEITICYGDQTMDVNGTFLIFFNPYVPYSVVLHSLEQAGYACLFTEAFIAGSERAGVLQHNLLSHFEERPVVPIGGEQSVLIAGLYQKMLSAHSSDYGYKNELLRSCVELIIHEALSVLPAQAGSLRQPNGTRRVTRLFFELLEKQFPIENATDPLRLRTAQDFAESLTIHVNYLNRSVKEVTGKPTSVHIAERIAAEAKALLQHTTWSVADIAYGLGFEYPTYFNNYFKRVTGSTPNSFRKARV